VVQKFTQGKIRPPPESSAAVSESMIATRHGKPRLTGMQIISVRKT
jgi:hypothetical protein